MQKLKYNCSECTSRDKGVFANVPNDLLDEFSKCRVTNTYKKGQVIFYEGNIPFGLYCMNQGKVKLYKTTSEGKVFISRLSKHGDLLGYRAFFTNEKYNATAEVLEDATICFLDKNKFLDLMAKHPPLAMELLSKFGKDLKCAEENTTNVAYKSNRERMVELLLSLKQSYGETQDDNTIKLSINLSRDEIASMIGTTTESAVRTLTWLKQKEILKLDKKTIYINDLDSLKNLLPQYISDQ